jgi:GntR family transcriptional regulator
MRHIRYQEIADELRERARSASAGTVLPSESELSAEFSASRVTVRRALEIVRDDGLIAARQGFGWFVATEPVRQRLERLGTIDEQLTSSGKAAGRHVLEFGFVVPPPHVHADLQTDRVLRVKRVSLADDAPFAVVTVWCPAVLAQKLSMEDVESRPFFELLDVELRGATQTIGAESAERPEAELLAVPIGAPLLKCRRITTDLDGVPVLVSEHVFPAHRTEFVVDLPFDEPSITPAGLRLVD